MIGETFYYLGEPYEVDDVTFEKEERQVQEMTNHGTVVNLTKYDRYARIHLVDGPSVQVDRDAYDRMMEANHA